MREDLALWARAVRPGGVLSGHDYAYTFPGVVQAVHELAAASGWALHLGPHATWWFRLPG